MRKYGARCCMFAGQPQQRTKTAESNSIFNALTSLFMLQWLHWWWLATCKLVYNLNYKWVVRSMKFGLMFTWATPGMFRKSPTTGSFLKKLTSTGKKSLIHFKQEFLHIFVIPKEIDKAEHLDQDSDKCVFQEDQCQSSKECCSPSPFLWPHEKSNSLTRSNNHHQTRQEQQLQRIIREKLGIWGEIRFRGREGLDQKTGYIRER